MLARLKVEAYSCLGAAAEIRQYCHRRFAAMNDVKFSLFLPTGDFAKARAAAEWADTHGFYAVSINDHFFSPLGSAQTPQLECFSTLSAIAAVTKNVRLAPAVTAMSLRRSGAQCSRAADRNPGGGAARTALTHRRIRHDLLHCVSDVGGISRSSGEGKHA